MTTTDTATRAALTALAQRALPKAAKPHVKVLSATASTIRLSAPVNTLPHWDTWRREVFAEALRAGHEIERVEIVASGHSDRVIRLS